MLPSHTSSHQPADTPAVTRLALSVFRLNGLLLHWGDRLVQPLGLTSARWQMLGAIALAGAPQTAPQLADAMGVTRQGAQKQLDLLLAQDLVADQPNPAHRRSPLYALTAQGRAVYQQVDTLWTAQASALAARLAARLAAPDVAAAQAALDTLATDLLQLPNLQENTP